MMTTTTINKPLLSVIIPFYNRADLIAETLDSVLNQTFHDFELICVDDGSNDNVPEILATYAKKDPRVKVIRKKHTTSGDTRNVGYQHSVGKYLLFLDSDDLYVPNYFETMVKTIQKENTDVVICKYDEFDHQTQEIIRTINFGNIEFVNSITSFTRQALRTQIFQLSLGVIWNKIYKREIIDKYHLCFRDLSKADDVFFNFYYLVKCSQITIVNQVLVHYRVHNNRSTTQNIKKPFTYCQELEYLRLKLTPSEFNEFQTSFYCQYLITTCHQIRQASFLQGRKIFKFTKRKLPNLQEICPQYTSNIFYKHCLRHNHYQILHHFLKHTH